MTTPQPAISVVIPTHNRRGLLEETVASVLSQTLRDVEVVVVDDVSEDDTWPWLQELEGRDPRARAIRLPRHKERSAARNAGFEAARGRSVLFLDDDDLLPGGALGQHAEALDRNPTAIASVGGFSEFFDSGRGSTSVQIVRRGCLRHVWRDLLFENPPVSGQCVFRSEVLRRVNGWDETAPLVVEDHDLWLRVAGLGPVALLPEIVLNYRRHSGQRRPRDLQHRMMVVRRRALGRLQGDERRRGESVLRARRLARIARRRLDRGRRASALLVYLQASLSAPSLWRSPLTRSALSEPFEKCLIGETGVAMRRRLVSWVRSLL